MDQPDEFAGQGGSYLVGADGKRKLVERTREPGATADTGTSGAAAPADAEATLPPVTKG